MDCVKKQKELLAAVTVKNLKKRHFDAYYCESREEAVTTALSLIKEGDTVTWGGTMTLAESGLRRALDDYPCTVIDRDAVPPEERGEIMRRAFFADVFIMSANAISADGELVNIDGTANRVAALCFGPRSVIVIAGMNKVTPDLTSALSRARNVAATRNVQRFDVDTPCKKTGVCSDCKCADSICSQVVVTRLARPEGRIKVILCGEDMGF